MPRSAEGIILLDLVQTLYYKARQIEERGIIITFDNKEMWRMANEEMKISNHYNQDAAAEVLVVDRLVREMNIDIVLNKVYAYRELKTSFLQDPIIHMVKICYIKANQV